MDKQTPDLSVCVVSYNTLNLLRQCLESIVANTSVTIEVFVVDNGSSDGTPDMICREFPLINLIRNTDNLGVAVATNQAIERMSGRYFITMNSDVVVTPGALDRLVAFMDSSGEVGAASARLVRPDGGEHPIVGGPVPTPWCEILLALAPLSRRIAGYAPRVYFGQTRDWTTTQEIGCIYWGTAMIIRREVIDEVGPQDPIFFVYAEDVDWVMRIAKAGWKLYYVADAEVVHYGGQSTRQASAKMHAMQYKNKSRLIQKHYGFVAGLMLRSAYASVWGIRILKWLFLYVFSGRRRSEAGDRIGRMWRIICSVITY